MGNTGKIKVFVTGGHVAPALAFIEELEKDGGRWEVVFVGRKYAMEGDTTVSEEYRLITQRNTRFLALTSGRLQRTLTVWTLWSLAKIPLGLVQAFVYCWQEKPRLIVSFGGYIALPVVIAGFILKIPCVTHEQTRVMGLANRIIGFFARCIFVSYPDTNARQGTDRTVVVGLPIRKDILTPPKVSTLQIPRDCPLIYITGGSTGSLSINAIVYQAIGSLLGHYAVVHQTGRHSWEKATAVRNKLPQHLRSRYTVVPFLEGEDLSWVLHQAHLVIGRSGANTVGELAVLGKVALFIPLPWAGRNEQYRNAEFMENAGCAQILNQKLLTPEMFVAAVFRMFDHLGTYQKKAVALSETIPTNAARRMVEEIRQKIIRF